MQQTEPVTAEPATADASPPERTTVVFLPRTQWADGIEVLVMCDAAGRVIRASARRPK